MIQFIDLKSQYKRIQDLIQQRINHVLEHGQYIMGPEILELENELAKYVGVKHCISLSSGTDALLVPLMALGIGPGDEVIVPDFSFFATAEVVKLVGAKCVFVDIEPETYNLNPKLLEQKITSKTKAIMPVSLYGCCADFDSINLIANKYKIPVIEDAAQSFGSTYKGRKSCSLSTVGATSFFPSKPLGGYGDSGACFTDDDQLALRMKEIRTHGQSKRYVHSSIGLNARMDTIQAAILIEKLKIFNDELGMRKEVAARYNRGIRGYKLPKIGNDVHAFAQYTIETDRREELMKFLNDKGIPTAIHYPGTLSEQPVFEMLGEKINADTPVAFKVSRRVLSLPFSPYLTLKDQDFIIENLNSFVNS